MWQKHIKRRRRYLKRELVKNQFAKVDLTVSTEFVDGVTYPGMSCYPFVLNLPQDLPASSCDSSRSQKISGLETILGYKISAKLNIPSNSLTSSEVDVKILNARLQ